MKIQYHSLGKTVVLIIVLIVTVYIIYSGHASKLPAELGSITLLAFLMAVLLGIAKTTTA